MPQSFEKTRCVGDPMWSFYKRNENIARTFLRERQNIDRDMRAGLGIGVRERATWQSNLLVSVQIANGTYLLPITKKKIAHWAEFKFGKLEEFRYPSNFTHLPSGFQNRKK